MPLDPFAYPASPLDQEDAPVARTPLVRAHEQPEEAAPTAKPDLKKLVAFAGDRFGVDPNVLAGMIMKESSLNDDVISGKRKSTAGAVGIAQFMPETAARYGVDPTDPVQSVMGMAAYMRDNLAKFNGDYRKAIAGYNWGENRKALDGHDWEDHAPAETKDYVDFVTKFATSLGSKPQAPSEQRSLPAGVSPSAETGGRGLINPALADPNAPAPTNAPSMASEIGLGTVDSFGIGSGNTVRNAGRFLQAPAADLKSSRDNLLAAAGVVGSHMSADDPDSALMGMPASGDTLVSQESVQALRDKARASADAAELQRQQNLHDGTFHGVAGKMLEEAGQGAQQHYQAELAQDAPRMLAASNEINNANGFVDTVKKSVMGDGLLGTLGTVAQSAPDTLIGMAVGSLAGKVTSAVLEKTAARAGQQAFEEVWAKARNTAASSAETAAAANAARAETYHGVLQEGAERVAGNVGNYVEGSQSGGSTGSQISDMVQQKKDDGTYAISNDDLLKNSPRFVALVNSGKPADQARTLLAAELSDEASPIAALWTRAAGKLSGAAEAEGKVLAGGHISAKTLVQNIGKEALEEGMQNPGENYAQYDSQRQVDPTQKFDLGGSIAQGVIGGIAQAGPMHGAGYLQSRLHPTAAATSFTESDSDSAKAGLTPIVVPNMPNAAPAVKAQEEDIHAGVSDALAALSGGSGAGLRGVDSGRVGNDGLSADGTAGVQPVSASPAEAGGSGGAVSEDGAASPAAPAVVGAGEDTGAAASLDNHNAIDGAEAAAPAQDKPETTWKGRSGTGFATEADAQQAVPGRALRAPTLDHRVEADGNGRYAINGYARSAVDIAAHAAATSPSNSLAVPTEAQKEAGNYQKGHLSIQGLNIAIENPKGSQRTGVDKGGKAWSTTMQSHYGYIKGTVGNDKDHVDTFIGPHTDSSKVFIVDQIHPSDGTFDEHKVVLGATSVDQARGIYDSNYDKGWKGAAGITEMPMPQFKLWVKDGVKSKPLSDLSGLPTRETNDANLTFPDITGSGVAEGSRADQGDARGRDVTDSMEFPTISDGPGAVGGATEDGSAGADLPSVLKRQAPSAPASTASMKYEQLGEHVGAAVTPFTGPRNDGQQLAGAIARVFGKTLDFYSVAPGAKGKPSAFIYDKKHVFIDATAGDGPVQLVMHEAMHGLGKERVAGLVEKLKPLMQNVDEFRDKLGYNDTNKHEELAAFFTQAQAQKPEFWKQVRDALGEGDFRTLAQAVLDKIDQLKAAFDKNLGDKFMARYATDIEAVRKIIVAEFAASASDKSQTSLQGDTQFSKATDVERSSRDLVEDPASFKQAAGLKPGTNGVREIGEALQKRTADTHGVIADTDTSTKARDQIAGAIADEVEHQLLGNSRANKSGVGWYSHNYPKALKALGKLYPELQKSKGARATFTAFLAVTSNGEKVGRNIAMARQLYETHRSGGDITKAIPGTKRQDVLDKNVHEISRLIALHGENGLPKFLLEEMKVGDINAALRAEGEKPSSSYPANMVMPRAALYFGPKLGAFYANLMGSSGYLTMDLWWSRSFNRMRGTLVPEVSEVTLKNMREKFGEPEATQEELVALAKPYEESYAKKNYKDGTSLETASNSFIKKAVYELNEAPARASDRQFMVDTAVKAQELLKAKGVDITLADMQAALWYYEKRLYGALGSKVVGDIGYQEALENAARETQPTGDAGSVGSDTRGAGKEDRAGARSDVPVESKSTQFSHGTSEAGGLQNDRGVRGGSRVLAESDRQAARDSGREDDGSLKGLPRKVGDFIASVFPTATKVAQDYAASRGMQYTPPSQYKKVDPARAARIATAFTEMKSDPQNPEVRAAYSAMIDETLAQYAAILKTGLKVEFIDFKTQGDPYLGNPRQMTADVRDNNHMWVFSTRDGFGTDAEFDVSANPLLAETAHQISGQAAMANDIFRVVHDYFGHVKEGVGFRADGEENAWRAHSAMYSPLARRAMTTETRGQNSWVNYGPHGEANRTAASADTIYADQKIGLMPEWVSEDAKGDTQFSNSTDTPAFQKWFGDSKVVDVDGQPLVVYHGTTSDIEAFSKKMLGRASGHITAKFGFFFSADADLADDFAVGTAPNGNMTREGANIMPTYLSIQNPYSLSAHEFSDLINYGYKKDVTATLKFIQAEGHDGIHIEADDEVRHSELQADTWIAFKPTQIKSAIGNSGAFDANDERTQYSNSTEGPEHYTVEDKGTRFNVVNQDGEIDRNFKTRSEAQEHADALNDADKNDYAFDLNSIKPGAQKPAAPVTKATDGWILSRDELGHFRFGAGAKLYRAVASIAQTVSAKVGMAPMSKELSRAVRVMKQESANAMELTAKVATAMNKMPESERQMISDIIEGELKAGVTPAKHVLDIAANISALMSRQTDELIEVGMLSAEAAEKWRDKYLPRFYESKLGDKVQDAWTKAVNRMSGKPRALQGIGGKSLKRRGLVEVIATKELKKYTDMGWVIDDPKFNAATDETVSVHRDFTRVEREKMGEIRDAMFRFVMGYTRSQKDLALGRLYEHLSETMASRHELPGYVRVPDSQIDGTDVSTYGKLAGLYVPQEVLSHLSQYGESEHEALLKMYRKGMGMWKEGKTVLNPVSHANNVASNLTMAHFAGVSYWDAHKYAGAIKDFFTNGGLMKEAKAAGLFGGTISESELMNLLPKEMQVMAQMTQSNSAKAVEHVWNTMSLFLRKPMGHAYQAEDLFFRYMIYKHARDQGLHDNDAVDYAQKFIFTYDDLPKGARVLRDVALPFFSYTYKVIPVMAETVLAYPWRYAAPMAVLHAVNSIAYAIAHGHDDDDDWKESIKKFVHGVHVGSLPNAGTAADRAFYDGAIQKEAMERKNLPPWMKGNGIALGTPKTIRLGMDHLTQLPVFLDVSRMFPGGDLLDMSSNTGGIPWLQNLTPSHPLLSTMTAMMFNRDPYFGKDVVDSNDTTKEAAIKRGQWLWTQVAPAIAISNYHWNRAGNAIAQATGHNIPWWPDDYTGFGKDGLPTQPKYAAMQTFGLKARPIDLDTAAQIDASQKKKMIADLETEMRGIRRLRGKQAISNEQAESKLDLDRLKVQRLRQGLDVNGNEKDD